MILIGVFMNLPQGDAEADARIGGLRQGLQSLGYNDLKFECRYGAGSDAARRKNAQELIALNPDVIHAASGLMLEALQQEMRQAGRTIPVVFAGVIDPVGTGKIESLDRPGGNATGCASIFFNIGAKWLALLKLAVPALARAVVVREGGTLAGRGQLDAVAGAAKSIGVTLTPVEVNDASEIERRIASLAGQADAGVIVTAGSLAAGKRKWVVELAREHRVPGVYPNRMYATDGGLIAYGPITVELYRSAAGYVDRIIRQNAKPGELPVQQTGKYELDINLQTARAVGIDVPPALLAFADRIID
jgi:putative ABC transport system substrate-binding protein